MKKMKKDYPVFELLKPIARQRNPKKITLPANELLSVAGLNNSGHAQVAKVDGCANVIEVRSGGNLENHGFYLNDEDYNWDLVRDNEGVLVLLPTRK